MFFILPSDESSALERVLFVKKSNVSEKDTFFHSSSKPGKRSFGTLTA